VLHHLRSFLSVQPNAPEDNPLYQHNLQLITAEHE